MADKKKQAVPNKVVIDISITVTDSKLFQAKYMI